MATTNNSLDYYANYIQDLKTKIILDLSAISVRLVQCKDKNARAALKIQARTLYASLTLLQGKDIIETYDLDLSKEIFEMEMQFIEVNDKLKETTDSLEATKQIILGLKCQLQASNLKLIQTAEANEDLRRQLEDLRRQKQLEESLSEVNTDATDEEEERVPSTAEPDAPAAESAVSVESLCGDTTPSDDEEHTQDENLVVPEPRVRRGRKWFVGGFKLRRADTNVALNIEAPDEECVPSNTEPDAPAAESAVSVESLCGDTTPSDDEEHTQDENLVVPEPRVRRGRKWFVGGFKLRRADTNVALNIEAPDEECVPSNTEPDAPAAESAVSVESLCGDTTPSDDVEHTQDENLVVPEPRVRRGRKWFVGGFKLRRADTNVALNIEAPDEECVPSNTEPDAPAAESAVSVESLCGDTTPSDDVEHTQDENLVVPEPRVRRGRKWFVGGFKLRRADTNVALNIEAPDEECVPSNTEPDAPAAESAVSVESLSGDTSPLSEQEKDCHISEQSVRRRRKNWFVSMFVCGRAEE
ncbi:hypothetical protein ABVT39_022355 [Epinephelus coioides]